MSDTGQTPGFWQEQLSDIDFSALPDAPGVPSQSLAITPARKTRNNKMLVMTMLAQVLHQLKYTKDDGLEIASALVLFVLPDGQYRAIFPSTYDRETIEELARAAEYFYSIILNED